jgi:phosphoribosylformylglycinamidine synthase PurS subunit
MWAQPWLSRDEADLIAKPGKSAGHPRYNTNSMKARVYVSLKSTVLDPQGQTIRSALTGLGYRSIADVRQGKFFEIGIDSSASRDQIHEDIDSIARDVLTNPVIEEYRVEFLD